MLPDDPVLKGRLFRAARALLHWNQAHLAARAGLSATTVNAIENTRHSAASTTSTRMVALALEAAGIRFLGMTDGLGHGLRYAGTVPRRPAGTVLPFGQSHGPAAPGRADAGRLGPGDDGSSEYRQRNAGRIAAAQLLVERQRGMVNRLRSCGHGHDQAVALLGEMERSVRLMRQTGWVLGAYQAAGQGARCPPRLAA